MFGFCWYRLYWVVSNTIVRISTLIEICHNQGMLMGFFSVVLIEVIHVSAKYSK
ncbi:hypothetical protein RO3G_01876 [Rhizopus delemar RA 99-880]|uniref:Uncharacterized protein n=1 Tax=Rhizopus delemar (strain RA 99-880 / ATCC MYA-4621 / FGSC 9543 / NRRL 43880) TaxID=246409 RepID=I1BLU2_RHIO9|nr:hypothetical protein RO3G_01876 [Rhizopus delemar RA 99-880]|eukprot:EIE77172.1 hypothetical protein RO3G_01876 [Rhizopus delemar RA 99-880]